MNKKLIIALIFIAILSINVASANENLTDVIGQADDLSSIETHDIVKTVGNSTHYEAKLYDNDGYSLKNKSIELEVNGITYHRTTDNNGIVRMNINLMPGIYGLKATNPVTGESKTADITVLANIIENHDLTKYYKNASQYTLRLIGSDGLITGSGAPVVFNINGVFYTRYTNHDGYATLNINLNPGTYIITAQNGIYKISNTITVLPTLFEYGEYRWNMPYNAQEQPLTYRDGVYRVMVLDGHGEIAHAGEKIIFNVNGVFYERYTSEAGVARLNINLPVGEYIITAEYNGLSLSNKIIVIPNPLYATIKGELDYEFTNTEWHWSPQHNNEIKEVYDFYGNSGCEFLNYESGGTRYLVFDAKTCTTTFLDDNGNFIDSIYMG